MNLLLSLCFLIILTNVKSNKTNNNNVVNANEVNESLDNNPSKSTLEDLYGNRDFDKDIEELDLSGYEEDIENVEELAKEAKPAYITQIYVYIRIDGKYRTYLNPIQFVELGSRYMTILQNAMLRVQLKRTGFGIFTCYFSSKAMIPDLSAFFLMQSEVDFIVVDNKKRFPDDRNAPIVGEEEREAMGKPPETGKKGEQPKKNPPQTANEDL